MPSRLTSQLRLTVAGLVVVLTAVLAIDGTRIAASPAAGHAVAAPAMIGTPTPLRVITWSGMRWVVYPHSQPGPHGDPMTDSSAAVRVDSKGRLHLSVTKEDGVWRSVELEALSAPQYGTYRFVVGTSPRSLGRPLDLGMFLYHPNAKRLTHEIDIEDSRGVYGIAPHDAQYVVQPFTAAHHTHKFDLSRKQKSTVQQLTWSAGKVHFLTRLGSSTHGKVFNHFTYQGADVPTPQGERLYINLWLYLKKTPGGKHSVVLDSFTYVPPGS